MGLETSVLVPWLLGAMAASSAAATGYSVYSGEKGRKAQEDAASKQEQAQNKAVAEAKSQERQTEIATNMANRKQPDMAQIMQDATKAAAGGPSGTMLTGPTGVNPGAINLGKSSLLGG